MMPDTEDTEDLVLAGAAAILLALHDAHDGWLPAGHVYMMLQSRDAEAYTLDVYYMLVAQLRGYVEADGAEILRITPRGRSLAAKIAEELAKMTEQLVDA